MHKDGFLRRMNGEDLGSKLRQPLIDLYMTLYQEEVMEFKDAAEVVARNDTVGQGAGGRR